MKHVFLETADGSTTIHLPELNEHYHSINGAITEARHVFIQAGLHYFMAKNLTEPIRILEIGFGTGLNAALSALEAVKAKRQIQYTGVEAYPLEIPEIKKLNYSKLLNISASDFLEFHKCDWAVPFQINPYFQLTRRQQFFAEVADLDSFHIIYFDAFGPNVQPDLWTKPIFEKMQAALKPEGILVTYSAKGEVRRTLEFLGFKVQRLAGPPGKREMLRAVREF